MAKNLEGILDECVDRINLGEKLEDCLVSYPEYVAELEPLLRVMFDTRRVLLLNIYKNCCMKNSGLRNRDG